MTDTIKLRPWQVQRLQAFCRDSGDEIEDVIDFMFREFDRIYLNSWYACRELQQERRRSN